MRKSNNDDEAARMDEAELKDGQRMSTDQWAKHMLRDQAQVIDMDEESQEGAKVPDDLVIVTRAEWGAIPPRKVEPKPHIATTIMFTYNTKTKSCFDKEKCCKRARKLQMRYMSVGFPDIPYNFMIGGDGRVYEGRGWNVLPQRHPKYYKLTGYMIEIAFMGDYSVQRPEEPMLDAVLDLIQYGRLNFLVKDRFGLIESYE